MGLTGALRRVGINRVAGGIEIDGNLVAGNIESPWGTTFYVDSGKSTSGNGRSWKNTFSTIQEAITASNAQVDWSATPWLVDNYILVAPGLYEEELTPAYSCHIIGQGVLGTDGSAEIHPTSGSALAGTGLNMHLVNLRFETETAVPVIDFGICNNVIIEGCEIVSGIAGLATHGISTENASYLQVRKCYFPFGGGGSGLTHAIYAAGGADKYFHACRIVDNDIVGVRSGGVGIYIQSNCTATQAIIKDNVIVIGGTGIGIDDNNGGSFCCRNIVSIAGAGTAIDHAGGAKMTVDNHVCVSGSGAIQVTSS